MGRKSIKYARSYQELQRGHYLIIMAELTKQTDRGMAVIGAAYIDLALRHAIESWMIDIPNVTARLFEDNGPLQSFSSRIHVGYALGLYKHAAFDDLRLVRDIRNAFAHSVEPIDFENEDVKRLCGQLWYPKHIHMQGHPDPADARATYHRAIEWLYDGLALEAIERAKKPKIPQHHPIFLFHDPQSHASQGKAPQPRPPRDRTQRRKRQEPKGPPQSSQT